MPQMPMPPPAPPGMVPPPPAPPGANQHRAPPPGMPPPPMGMPPRGPFGPPMGKSSSFKGFLCQVWLTATFTMLHWRIQTCCSVPLIRMQNLSLMAFFFQIANMNTHYSSLVILILILVCGVFWFVTRLTVVNFVCCRNASRHERPSSSDAPTRLRWWSSSASSIRLPEGSTNAPTAASATPGAHETNAPLDLSRQAHHVFIFIPRFIFTDDFSLILYCCHCSASENKDFYYHFWNPPHFWHIQLSRYWATLKNFILRLKT